MSKNIYITYLTIYSGKCLPKYYIGSSTLKRINKGYRGSVISKKYKSIWLQEQKENPELFETIIVRKFADRKDALKYELQLHKEHDVVKNPLFINMAYASVNGFFGMDVSGKNNPNFNKHHSKETKLKISKAHTGKICSKQTRKKRAKNWKGKLNPEFIGYYHTPFGILESSTEIKNYTDKICRRSIIKWCKNPDTTITRKSKYLTENMLGKTYRDIGFWFKMI